MGSSSLFTSALSGMNAAQLGLATTQHNIANASTPAFTRQEVQTSSRAGQQTGAGFIGQGVDISSVKRIYDQFLTTQVLQEQAQANYLSAYHSAMKQIDNLVADPTAGASPAMQDFFSAMNGVANSPESIPARQTLLGNAQFVANRFQAINQRLTDIADGLNGQVTSSVNSVNTYAQQIATLNSNIKLSIAAGQGQQPNDLMDQRDQVISQLNEEIKVSVQVQADGTATVFIGNGQALVINEQAMALRTVQSASDPSKLEIGYKSGSVTISMQQSSLQGGNLGAYLTFRDQSLEPARNALGRVAMGLASSINQQNQLGQDLKGALGGNVFNTATPYVVGDAGNTGTAVISAAISSVSALTTSDYQLRFDGASYSIVRLSDNNVTNLGAALPQTVDGFTVSLTSGAAAAGDSFLIRPTANGARDISVAINDPNKIAAAAPMRTAATLTNSGSGLISAGTVNSPPPPNANLQNSVTVTFVDATHYTVVDNTASTTLVGLPGTVYNPAAGATLSFNGWTAQITGAPVAGDTFSIVKNTNATGDNRNALLMAGLQTQNLMDNGTASLQGAYGQLVGEVGAKTHELDVTSRAQSNMVAQTVASQQAVSGVNLDEEAANLLRYQRAYQAAAKAMQIAGTMFDALMEIGG
ncbi:MAG: flagellar hook-associated protein FlgK [Gallionella sp.]|nr:MAG: flagellar hook-associated protein FlgK [Gallionella sp.]